MAMKRFQLVRTLYLASEIGESSHLLGSCRSYSSVVSNGSECSLKSSVNVYKGQNRFPLNTGKTLTRRSTMAAESSIFMNWKRMATTQVKAPAQARQMRALKITISSPGFIYEPYAPLEPISFWKRWFTRSGWKRTKDDIILELKSAYAIQKLRKSGYSKTKFYNEAVNMYKEINTLIATGDKRSLRKVVTENMFSTLKNELKQRETAWSTVYWELVEPVVKIRTLRARLIGVDKNDLNKVFIQLTLEFLAKQKFEAYDFNGTVVAGEKNKEVLVRDIWVFEKSLFHPGACWRLCGRIPASKSSP